MVEIMQNTQEKVDLCTENESKHHKNERFVWTEINLVLEKNGGNTPSSLGSRSIVVVRQADKVLAVCKIFKIRQLQF